jgi:hypothetical protein
MLDLRTQARACQRSDTPVPILGGNGDNQACLAGHTLRIHMYVHTLVKSELETLVKLNSTAGLLHVANTARPNRVLVLPPPTGPSNGSMDGIVKFALTPCFPAFFWMPTPDALLHNSLQVPRQMPCA